MPVPLSRVTGPNRGDQRAREEAAAHCSVLEAVPFGPVEEAGDGGDIVPREWRGGAADAAVAAIVKAAHADHRVDHGPGPGHCYHAPQMFGILATPQGLVKGPDADEGGVAIERRMRHPMGREAITRLLPRNP